MPEVVYGCPKCGNTSVYHDYGLRMIVCEKCKTPCKEFKPVHNNSKSKT